MRSLARETAFKIIYKSFFLDGDLSCDEILEEDNITEELDKDFNDDNKFVREIVSLYGENKDSVNSLIDSHLKGYTPERVYKIDRAILATAITELNYYKLTPFKVVVNEAVEMAKKYSTEKSYSFVNGMLKTILGEQNAN
ncbi:MAG: transcription antitermination factor NusB [Eubacteriales bacterium]|nr:transcription antitermination factor NusB [Clostridia bacterium]MDY2695767.1 transcription antitermination factor NusB [Eubacteriales bacterium]